MATGTLNLQAASLATRGLFDSPGSRRALLSLLLGLLTLIAYNPLAHNNFVGFDDPAYISGNRHVRSGLTWHTVEWAFRSTEHANWHPLTWLSHALDYQLFHANPLGHHYENVLLHAITVVLLFLFLESTTGLAWRSSAVAALFAVHPINVESVAWASERKNVLCTLFFILALIAYSRYVRNANVKRYLLVTLLFAFALMSKPMVVTFPFVLLLLDYWPLARMNFSGTMRSLTQHPRKPGDSSPTDAHIRSFAWLLREKLPFLALSAVSVVITMAVQGAGGAIRREYSFTVRLLNAILSYSLYVKKAIWPSQFSVLYPFSSDIPGWEVLGSSLLIMSITTITLILRRNRYLAVGWFWYLGTLVPVIGLVQVGEQAMADRYAYVPFIGLFIATVWGISDWTRSKHIAPSYLATAAVIVVAGLGVGTDIQIGYWRDTTALWSHALAVTQRNFVAHDSIGAELLDEGRVLEAIPHFQAAAEINPEDAFSRLDLGVCEKRRGNIQAAIEYYEAALRLSADPALRSTALSNLGSIYRASKNYPRARESYESALELLPDNELALTGLALVTQKTGDLANAINYYSRAATLQPSDITYLLLAQALSLAGRKQEAEAVAEQVQRGSPDLRQSQETVNRLLSE